MKYILFTLVLVSFTNKLFSQSSFFDIKAVVVDQNDSLVFGNIIALSPSDSSIIKGAYFLDGNAELLDIKEAPVLVKFSSIGYKDTIIPVNNASNQKLISLGKVVMETSSQELGEVTVSATIPLFEPSDEGGVKVNVKKTMLGSSTSVLEVLSKSPGVIVNGSSISVVGKGEALIYKDGKRITADQLNNIPVQSIEKIEIINNPSSKYDAEGRAVINIIMVVNHAEGFEVAIIQNFIIAKHFLWAPAASLSYRKGKFSLSTNYSVTLGKDWNKGTYDRSITNQSDVYQNNSNNEENTRLTYVGNHSLGLAYQFNSKHSISAEYSGLYNIFDLDVDGDNTVTPSTGYGTRLLTKNNGNTTNFNNSASLNYNGVLDTLGSTIFVGGQYSSFNNQLNDLIDETIFYNENQINEATRNNVGTNDISIITGRVDVAKNLKNGMTFEFGGKYGDVVNKSKIDLYTRTQGTEFTLIPGYSNDFEYQEKIPAAYLQWKGNIRKKWKYSIGARSELSMIKGISNTLDKTVIDTTYFNLFPNATFSYAHSEKWNYSLAYTSRISRPKYQDLDPFLWYQDSLTSIQGNPFLLPELVNGGEATVQFKTYSLKMGYNHSQNPSRMVLYPGNTGGGSVIMRRSNFQTKHSLYTTLSVPFNVKFWKSYNTISLTFDKYEDDRPEFQVGKITPQLYAYSYHQFKVKNWFNIELIFDYEGTRDDGIYRDNQRYSVSMGLSKYMLNGDLTLRFLANDVLQTYRETGSSTIGQVSSTYDRKLNTNFYRLSVIYYFGKLRYKSYSNQSTGAEEMDRIKK